MTDHHRIAIAGIGTVAEVHALSIRDLNRATLVAGSCRTESRGREFAAEFDCEWYGDTGRMLDEADPGVLIVCTPSGAHSEPTLAAAARNVDVLCEKPLEITADRIDRMVAAAEDAGITLGGVFQQRFDPLFRRVREAADAGRFGQLSAANAYVPWWRDDDYYDGGWQGTRDLDGGELLNQAIHGIDLVQWLAGATMDLDRDENPIAEVFAYTDRLAHAEDSIAIEDTAVASVRYRDGSVGQILGATSMYPGSSQRIQLGGREGTAEMLADELVTWEFREEREDDERIRREFGSDRDTGDGEADVAMNYANHRRNIKRFIDGLDDEEPYPLDAVEARKAVDIIEAIYESAERSEPVRLL
ncbi:Gfo/Idh/MocA family oxidoreductase [Halogeometricum sp. S1BR25-6]|uniref:Gfo/Idh/MocA family oxidoreductase n=1 Tax=Halogeometricum salsisoli TaxID=2950536 RepID=A0ABU2GHM6_9EURY|nr:Gfo/Idh/MocA family oxidoreductase [Halogeometricum sp. S1BR25-6]MDS0300332.1 Gfo/Idh/MocA family oxidoreductase [Halogeometricum sp. S1BR25-6]